MSAVVQPLASSALPAPRFRYTPAVKAGPCVRVSGMVALDPRTGALETGGPGAETARIMANLIAALPDFALTLDDMVSARIFTTHFERFVEINAAWDTVVARMVSPPARTSVGVTALPLGAAVEIEFEFYKE